MVAMGGRSLAGQGGWSVAGGNGWSRWMVGRWLVLGEVDGRSVAGAGQCGWSVAGGDGWSRWVVSCWLGKVDGQSQVAMDGRDG